MRRLELAGITICSKCGRGRAELRSDQGDVLSVVLDPVRARELTTPPADDDLRTLIDVVLGELEGSAVTPREVVLDLVDGRLRGLVSLGGGDESEIIACTAEEAVALVVRGQLKVYASAEALAHAAALKGRPDRHGPETVH